MSSLIEVEDMVLDNFTRDDCFIVREVLDVLDHLQSISRSQACSLSESLHGLQALAPDAELDTSFGEPQCQLVAGRKAWPELRGKSTKERGSESLVVHSSSKPDKAPILQRNQGFQILRVFGQVSDLFEVSDADLVWGALELSETCLNLQVALGAIDR